MVVDGQVQLEGHKLDNHDELKRPTVRTPAKLTPASSTVDVAARRHGAENLMNTGLPAVFDSHVSFVSSRAPTTEASANSNAAALIAIGRDRAGLQRLQQTVRRLSQMAAE